MLNRTSARVIVVGESILSEPRGTVRLFGVRAVNEDGGSPGA
jgi:hypothetical protein